MKKVAATSGHKVRFLFLEGEEELTVEIGCCCTAVFNFYGYLLRRSLFSGPTRARNKPAIAIYRQSRTAQAKISDYTEIRLIYRLQHALPSSERYRQSAVSGKRVARGGRRIIWHQILRGAGVAVRYGV